jgi:hypothetical protein
MVVIELVAVALVVLALARLVEEDTRDLRIRLHD